MNSFRLQNFSHQTNTVYAAALLQSNNGTKKSKPSSYRVFPQQSFDPSKGDIAEILWSPAGTCFCYWSYVGFIQMLQAKDGGLKKL